MPVPDKLTTKKAAIYIRVSTKYQVDGDSLDVQRKELIAYSQMVLGIQEYEVFEDAGFSGKNTDRPEYQHMMNRLRTGEFSHLLVWKIDRISRNLLDFASMYNELKDLGVAFVSKNEQFDTSNAIGEAMLKIILVFAELERNMTSERVTATMLARANEGKWNGGTLTFGYMYDRESGLVVKNPKESDVVNFIFDSYEKYRSIIYVCRLLNDSGSTTRKGHQWATSTISHILCNDFYIGNYKYNMHKGGLQSDGKWNKQRDKSEWLIIPNHHEPYLSKERFEMLASFRRENLERMGMAGERHLKKHIHVFSGLLECGCCGGSLISAVQAFKFGDHISTYYCSVRRKDMKLCPNSCAVVEHKFGEFLVNFISNIISAKSHIEEVESTDDLEQHLLRNLESFHVKNVGQDGLNSILSLIKRGDTVLEYRPLSLLTSTSTLKSEVSALEESKRKLETALNRLNSLFLYSDTGIPEKDFLIEREKITAKLNDVSKKIEESKRSSNEMDNQSDFLAKATYLVLTDRLSSEEYIPYSEYIEGMDKAFLRSFFRTIITKLVITGKRITSMEFKNGITLDINYE